MRNGTLVCLDSGGASSNSLIAMTMFPRFSGLLNLSSLALAVCAVIEAPANVKPRFNWNATKYVYAFGDSYTFVGGTQGYPSFRYVSSKARNTAKVFMQFSVSSEVPSTSLSLLRNFSTTK